MLRTLLFWLFCSCFSSMLAQDNFNRYKNYLPISDQSMVGWSSTILDDEELFFEASPIMRFGIYSNVVKNLRRGEKYGHSYHLTFSPHLRMYKETSKPVKSPSYKINIGYQRVYLFGSESRRRLFSIGIEHGHYSNGQNRCTYSDDYRDGTSDCDKVYETIADDTNLSQILNRNNGNYSTNLTQLSLQYDFVNLDEEQGDIDSRSTFGFTFERYHKNLLLFLDIGGYSDNDIDIYGKYRFRFLFERYNSFFLARSMNNSLRVETESILNPHPHVDPHRLKLTYTVFPFNSNNDLGVAAFCSVGHDIYNNRFLDSGFVYGLSLSWSFYPNFYMNPRVED